MQAYYELETDITANHELHLQLPDTIPAGRVKVALIYEMPTTKPKTLLDFLGAGKQYHRFSSAEDIDNFITGNREPWLCND
jgi:hypothetical protein